MIIRNNITEVAYNAQTTVDAKNNIPIDYKVTNHNDSKAMGNMLQRAKSILRTNDFTALYDKGYHTGSEFDTAERLGIKVMVAIPAIPKSSHAPDPDYNVENFIYNKDSNIYTCPQGHILSTNGTIKRQWGFSYIMTKKYLNRANADVGFMMTAYNLGRIINILGINIFREYLKTILSLFFHIFESIRLKKIEFKGLILFAKNIEFRIKSSCNELRLSQNMSIY